jgi:hypothetical protein
MSSLTTAILSGAGLVLAGFWFGAGYGYACRCREERRDRDEAVCAGQVSQGEYAEWLMRMHESESRNGR